jgi:uncharacterized protein (DUF2237 family)
VADLNVLGGALASCGTEPLTGFFRDGCCRTGPEDRGSHTVCAVVTAEFLEHQQRIRCPSTGFLGWCPATGGV